MEKIKVLLADDHAVLRGGVRLLINSQDDLLVVGEVGDGAAVSAAVSQFQPDVLLLDLAMPGMDGISVIKNLKLKGNQVRILVLTMYDDEGYLKNAIQAGAEGYLLKQAAETELLNAIRMVARGSHFVDPAMAGNMVSRIWSDQEGRSKDNRQQLSDRELEVLRLIALGYTNQQIANELVLSIKTVESHKANIKTKLNLTSRSELVRYAIEQKVI